MTSANISEPLRVVIATTSEGLRDQLRHQVLGMGFECAAGDCVAHTELPVRLAQGADLILISTTEPEAQVLEAIQHARGHGNAPILAVGPVQDPKLILQAQRCGAREFIDLARLEEEFPLALERLRQAGAMKARQGKTVAVISANPGAGVTMVASNLAFALAESYPGRVALAEVGAGVPELALDLDLAPPHTVEELVGDWERMDPRMVRQALAEHPAGVQVLACAPESLSPADVSQNAMRRTVLLLQSLFDFTVLDLGHSLTASALEALALTHVVVVVVRLDVPSLRLARRFLSRLVDQGVDEKKLRVAANRYGQRGLVGWKKIEQALGFPVQVWIPDDPAAVNDALNHGKPLLQTAHRAKITRRFGQLAGCLNGHC
jgi:pilus assembly protein CpaE